MDIAIVHTLAPSIPISSVKTGLEECAQMERVKVKKYADQCFHPVCALNIWQIWRRGRPLLGVRLGGECEGDRVTK